MPFSDADGKNKIRQWLNDTSPETVLDIGPGAGTYGLMVRDILNVSRLDAIEAWGPYIEKYDLNKIYDQIIVSDVVFVDDINMAYYDVVIIGDVIEHLSKSDASLLLEKLITNHNHYVIISFPVLHLDQGSYEGNFFETHVDHWSVADMDAFLEDLGAEVLDTHVGDVLACYLVRDNRPN